MSAFKTRLLTNWHIMRIFRLGIGVMAVAEGFYYREAVMGMLGVFFLYQSITDSGCCSTRICYMPPTKKDVVNTDSQNI